MNRMQVINLWTSDGPPDIQAGLPLAAPPDLAANRVAVVAVACSNAHLEGPPGEEETGDPAELALLHRAAAQGVTADNLQLEQLLQFSLRSSPASDVHAGPESVRGRPAHQGRAGRSHPPVHPPPAGRPPDRVVRELRELRKVSIWTSWP
jgi:hypothetical protein